MKKTKKRVSKKKQRSEEPKSCSQLLNSIKNVEDLLMIEKEKYEKIKKCITNENIENFKKQESPFNVYPHLDDLNFSEKITKKKEFYDAKMLKKDEEDFANIEEITNTLCNENRNFELEAHQIFVRNFLSFQTPYNSLLLFHGLGTGKTCSSILVCEEMRTYLNQIGIHKRILVVANSVVQENYKLQLFDERKLKKNNGLWSLKACTGNKFLKEINPMNTVGLSRQKVISQINKIINQSYLFLGYTEFANYINRIIVKTQSSEFSDEKNKKRKIRALRNEFSNRLIIIDEVHNIRKTDVLKRTSKNLLEMVTYSENIKLLLLTATPMFNDYREIIWILNLLNLNDNRFPIKMNEIFDSKGEFLKIDGKDVGKELLIQKIIGYVSFVKGENPFKFPYRLWPEQTQNKNSLKISLKNKWLYPKKQLNGLKIKKPIQFLDLILTDVGDMQKKAYLYVIDELKRDNPSLSNPSDGIQYTSVDPPLQVLNMTYPHEELEKKEFKIKYPLLYGKKGLNRTMISDNDIPKSKFEYKKRYLEKFGRFFSPDKLKKYSGKLYQIIKTIKKSKGICIIYSKFIDGGCLPIALALEEIGFTRYNGNSLFKKAPIDPLNVKTLKNEKQDKDFYPAKYAMITGDKYLSKNNSIELKAATNPQNINGEIVKVIIISRAGSEGLDFKNVRQIHILEPWYNINRTEQIIGRAVRNLGHCKLPYMDRNVEIFLYATKLNSNTESIDLYMYRLAEKKALQIGKLTRILKEYSIDCNINKNQQLFSQNNIGKKITLRLSSDPDKEIQHSLGDRENSIICDFMNCEYKCKPKDFDLENMELDTSTYNEHYVLMNLDKINQRIKSLFKEAYVFSKEELIKSINSIKHYPIDQILNSLNYLITDDSEFLEDMLGRNGKLINIGNYYLFQPIETINSTEQSTELQRKTPIDFKQKKIRFKIPDNFTIKEVEINKDDKTIKTTEDTNVKIIEELTIKFNYLMDSSKLKIRDKHLWFFHAALTIDNLVKYNNLDKELLLLFCLEHVVDSMKYTEKLFLINYLFGTKYEKLDNLMSHDLKKLLQRIFNKFKIQKNNYDGIVLSNFFTPVKKQKLLIRFKILILKNGEWVEDRNAYLGGLGENMLEKFKYDLNKKNINKYIGLLTIFKSKSIIFKFIEYDHKKKIFIGKGQQCGKGELKKSIINRINKLTRIVSTNKKYILNGNNIIGINDYTNKKYNKNEIKQIINETKKEIKINTDQLCVETEMLYRYLNEIKHDDKIWFFSTIENILNNY
jgi:superfamily II DNA or RNA helicase